MKKDKRTKRKNNLKFLFFLPTLIFSIFIYGCPSNNVNPNNFYLAGTISVSSPSTVSVYIVFYSKDCNLNYDNQGNILSIENYSIVGNPFKYNLLNTRDFLAVLPEPYDSIGGVMAWIDRDDDGYPDTFDEDVILLQHVIDGYSSIITGINYDDTKDNFLVDYVNDNGSFQEYLTIIGITGYEIKF